MALLVSIGTFSAGFTFRKRTCVFHVIYWRDVFSSFTAVELLFVKKKKHFKTTVFSLRYILDFTPRKRVAKSGVAEGVIKKKVEKW